VSASGLSWNEEKRREFFPISFPSSGLIAAGLLFFAMPTPAIPRVFWSRITRWSANFSPI